MLEGKGDLSLFFPPERKGGILLFSGGRASEDVFRGKEKLLSFSVERGGEEVMSVFFLSHR